MGLEWLYLRLTEHPMLKALLLDLDGTLVNTDPLHFQVWRDVLLPYGLDIDLPFYQKNFSGRLNPDIVRDLLPHLSDAEGIELSDRKEAEFRRRDTTLKPLPGLMDLLAWMERCTLKRAIVTNAPAANAEFMLRALGLTDTFPIVVLGEAVARPKPDPLPYQTALERVDVDATEAIAFEDSPSGLRSAVGAGIATVGIASTHAADELYAVGAAIVVEDFTDPRLWDWLETTFPWPVAP